MTSRLQSLQARLMESRTYRSDLPGINFCFEKKLLVRVEAPTRGLGNWKYDCERI